jgi:hypothetical protein
MSNGIYLSNSAVKLQVTYKSFLPNRRPCGNITTSGPKSYIETYSHRLLMAVYRGSPRRSVLRWRTVLLHHSNFWNGLRKLNGLHSEVRSVLKTFNQASWCFTSLCAVPTSWCAIFPIDSGTTDAGAQAFRTLSWEMAGKEVRVCVLYGQNCNFSIFALIENLRMKFRFRDSIQLFITFEGYIKLSVNMLLKSARRRYFLLLGTLNNYRTSSL